MQNVETFDFLINRLSGAVLRLGVAAVEAEVRAVFGVRTGTVRFIEGREIASSMRAWVSAHAGSHRAIVIGGGDGTVLTAASEVIGRDDVMMGVLPLGTHNIFARQLGFSADFRKAILQLNDSHPASIDVGRVNGKYFLCGVMVDKNTALFYSAREDWRIGKKWVAAKKIARMTAGLTFGRVCKVKAGGEDISGRIIFVMNNKMNPRPLGAPQDNASKIKSAIENLLSKDRHDDGMLALYAVQAGVEGVSILPAVAKGKWLYHESVQTKVSSQMIIENPDAAAGNDTVIVLDGEPTPAAFPLVMQSVPAALRVYRPYLSGG